MSRAKKVMSRSHQVLNAAKQGRKRSYNYVSGDKLKKMMELSFQTRTEAKIKLAVNAYCQWCNDKLDTEDCPKEILYADIHDTCSLMKQNFEFTLCRFIVEVKKSKEDGDYPGHTLYQMACALQNHLKKKELNWKLVHGDEFQKFN